MNRTERQQRHVIIYGRSTEHDRLTELNDFTLYIYIYIYIYIYSRLLGQNVHRSACT